jgi:hypothetical protein
MVKANASRAGGEGVLANEHLYNDTNGYCVNWRRDLV